MKILNRLLISGMILSASTVYAFDSCRDAFPPWEERAADAVAVRAENRSSTLSDRLKIYLQNVSSSGGDWADAILAKNILSRLELKRNENDLAIFSDFLGIKEASIVGEQIVTTYNDPYSDVRPSMSLFQNRSWDWKTFDIYFSESASQTAFTKLGDLEYLKHVDTFCKAHPGLNFRNNLTEANFEWEMRHLAKFPHAQENLKNYRGSRHYSEVFANFLKKIDRFSKSKEAEDKSVLLSEIRRVMPLFQNGTSIFDLYLLETFFDSAVAHDLNFRLSYKDGRQGKIDPLSGAHDPRGYLGDGLPYPVWLQMGDARVFEMGLSSGSFDYVADFLLQNSHDVEFKSRLLLTLERMRENLSARKAETENYFYMDFTEAEREVLANVSLQTQPPERIQTDLKIFSISKSLISDAKSRLNETLIAWDPIAGKLHSSLVESFPLILNKKVSLSSSPNMKTWVRSYFNQFRVKGTYLPNEIDHDESAEMKSLFQHSTFLAFTRRGTDQLLSMIRIFDGSNHKTFIEREFPSIVFPERISKTPIYEIGRLLSTADVSGNSLPHVMANVADYFQNTSDQGMVYMDGNEIVKNYYLRNGATVFKSPSDLSLAPGATPVWIMKIPVKQIIQRFGKAEYSTVRLKKTS